MRRLFVIATAVALLMSPTMLARTATTAEFVSGTVKSIPANTTGSLDAGSSSELSFHYGKSVFSLPYRNITSTEVTEPTGHHIWKVPVPKLGKSPRFLNITYKDGDSSRMLTFKAPASAVTALVHAIDDRRREPQTAAAKAAAIKTDTEAWWGDRYWRTSRNKQKWPDVPAENSPGVPAGTKE